MIRLILIAALLSCAAVAHAAPRRYAVVIGNNEGLEGDQRLRYAERDAERVAATMTAWGGVEREDLRLVLGLDAAGVERELLGMVERVRGRDDTVLFIYYSGHGDGEALHLSGTRLPLSRLYAIIDGAPATVRLLVVDACHSGELTRRKGATPAEPFAIAADDRLVTEGVAIITSSAASETAHESDHLRGGVFTHHFITGLRGAADESGDRRVTLREVYDYAYRQTLRTTSRARATQHPTFSFELRGQEDVVLTRLAGAAAGRLRFAAGGEFTVLQADDDGRAVAELTIDGATEILLEPGEYLVRLRTDEAVFEVRITVRSGEVTVIELTDMRARPYGGASPRGAPGETPAVAVEAAPSPRGRWWFGLGIGRGVGHATSGQTEQERAEVACCLAFEGTHARLEVGAWVDDRWAVSVVGRYGTHGADLRGHAGAAPALLARLTRARSLHGWALHADAGFGVIRHGVQLSEPVDGRDIDSHAMGPVLLGGGARWSRPLVGDVAVVVDGNVLAGISTGLYEWGTGFSLDLSLGLAWVR